MVFGREPPPPQQPRATLAERLSNVKLLLEILAVLVGLIGTIVTLIVGSSK
jgi:hypothetical protein